MRPATPDFSFAAQQAGLSPPQTPTTPYAFGKNRRNGMHFPQLPIQNEYDLHFPQLPSQNGNIVPNGQGTGFSYQPSARLDDLSPRSSTPESESAQSSASGSPPRSLASSQRSPGKPLSSFSPPRSYSRVVADANFTLEEFGESEYEGFDSDGESVIRPHQYEDAESERALSVKSASHNDLPSKIYTGIREMNCDPDELEEENEAFRRKQRMEKRRKRRSSGTQKRTFSQSIGSDTDDEDVQPVFEGANEAGSSARRLRRKGLGDERTSLIFDDPPPRIDEMEEPESCEELVEVKGSEDEGQGVDRNLPFYYIQEDDMDVDTDDE